MKIGIVGAGWLGGTVGRVWVRAGHEVMFSSRTPGKLANMVTDLGAMASTGTFRDAAKFGDVVLVAVRYPALADIARDIEPLLRGKIVLDACNPYAPDDEEVVRTVEAAGVARTSASYFPTARLVRAFSSVDATEIEASAANSGNDAPLAVPLSSDDGEAMTVAAGLVRDAGCAPVIVGDLSTAAKFENGAPAFRLHVGEDELRRVLGTA